MKYNSIATAVALAVSAYSSGAMALAPTVAPDITLYIAGATAQDQNIGLLVGELCVTGTLDTYQDMANPAKPGAAHTAYFCTMNSSKVTGLAITKPNDRKFRSRWNRARKSPAATAAA